MPGQPGNCIIAAHRDTHFRVLKDILPGDRIVLETREGQYTYRVKSTRIVLPTDTESLQPTRDAELHLITCYPFYYVGNAPKRFIVQAGLDDSVPERQPALDTSMYNGSNARGQRRVLSNTQTASLRFRGD